MFPPECRKMQIGKSSVYRPSDSRLSERVPRGQRDGSLRPYPRLSSRWIQEQEACRGSWRDWNGARKSPGLASGRGRRPCVAGRRISIHRLPIVRATVGARTVGYNAHAQATAAVEPAPP
jgi:hypothetical protein